MTSGNLSARVTVLVDSFRLTPFPAARGSLASMVRRGWQLGRAVARDARRALE